MEKCQEISAGDMNILVKEPISKELLHQIEKSIWEIVVMTTDFIEVEVILIREENHLMKEDIPTEIEDLPEEEDHKIMEDPLMEEDPLMMEDPLMEMEDPQDTLVDEDHQDLEDLLDQ